MLKDSPFYWMYLFPFGIGIAFPTLYEIVPFEVRIFLLEDVFQTRPFVGELLTEILY